MIEGFILDVRFDKLTGRMISWIVDEDGVTHRFEDSWTCTVHVRGERHRLVVLSETLQRLEYENAFSIESCRFEQHLVDIESNDCKEVLAIDVARCDKIPALAQSILAAGSWHHLEIFSIDPVASQRYLLDQGLHPLGRVRIAEGQLIPLDCRMSESNCLPKFRVLEIHVECRDVSGHRSPEAAIDWIDLKSDDIEWRISNVESKPRAALSRLHRIMDSFDPHVILTQQGDWIDMPALFNLSERVGQPLRLSRTGHDGRPRSEAFTSWSYGRLIRKEAKYSLEGRIHIVASTSFIFKEGGFEGLFEISRMSGIPPQDIACLSPGSAISAIQIRQAIEDGVLIPWKKNRAEDIKTALELLHIDRGGLYLDPKIGVHHNVVEIDFASLFPSIIASRNISPETMGCLCCNPEITGASRLGVLPLDVESTARLISNRRRLPVRHHLSVPNTRLYACTRQHGFLGRVVAPIIERRRWLKSCRQSKGDEWDRRQNILKWLLVTCFGYTGYRNARFGRIECHEAICAWAREILLIAIEESQNEGWNALHAIVDSLWLSDLKTRNSEERRQSIDRVIARIEARVGVHIDLEDEYDWIAFIPNRTNGVGALTKYFGHGNQGWKIRGIELRQHSTCTWIRNLQNDALEILRPNPSISAQRSVVSMLHERIADLRRGAVPLQDLIIARRVNRSIEDSKVVNLTTSALLRARWLSREIPPGHRVRFAVIGKSRIAPIDRIRLDSEIESSSNIIICLNGDPEHYVPIALRSISAILSAFGWDENQVSSGTSRIPVLSDWC